jgi:outer membrane protein assembly factor BamB
MSVNVASRAIPVSLAVVGAAVLVLWLAVEPHYGDITQRVPGQDNKNLDATALVPIDLKGAFTLGDGKSPVFPTSPGAWPRFRGAAFDAISTEEIPLARKWPTPGPPKLWEMDLGEGFAGAAILNGRVYLLDYDEKLLADVLRCLSILDGKEIWKRSYSIEIGRFHGISRTVPAVTDRYVVTLGPKCHVLCVDAQSGDYKWGIDLVAEHKTKVPQWYAGQCPLIDGGRVILAPAGESLLIAVEGETGKIVWKTPNPRKWQMTHSSVIPMSFKGRRMYVYCGSGGVVGVSADDGKVLWETTEWRVNMATVPSPLPIGEDRIFLSGGYGAGSMMLALTEQDGKIIPSTVFRLGPEVFGAEQHTPIYYKNHIYGLVPTKGQLVCLDLQGKPVWNSGPKYQFGLGPFMIADGMLIVLSEKGQLMLVEATEKGFNPIAQAKVIENAHEAWAPLALAGGRLIARDIVHMVCLDLRKASNE